MWFLNKHLPWINAASTSRTSVVAHLFLCLFICPFCCSFLFCFVLLVVCLFVFKLTNSISYSVNSAKESATFWIRFPEWKFLNTLWIRNCVDTKSGFFFLSGDEYTVFKMATSFPGSLKAKQDANFARFTTQALLPIFPEESWVLKWIQIRFGYVSIWIRYVWTWTFLNPERKSCGFKNIWILVDGA